MRRRGLILAAAAWPALAWMRAVSAQSKQPVLIGWLGFTSRESMARSFAAFKAELAALGWKEGAQIRIEDRWAQGQEDRLPFLTQELVGKKPALIVAWAMRVVVVAAKNASGIPIVMVTANDPVAAGLVTNLARPGGMITGIAGFNVDLAGKFLELLLAAAPKTRRVGFLAYSRNPNHVRIMEAARRSVTQHSVEAHFAEVALREEIEPAILRLAKDGAQALVVLPGVLHGAERQRIMKLALAQRWPVVAALSSFAASGALLSYGTDFVASTRRAAHYVDRILKGTKPGDLPVEQPTKFELVINLKTAKALGLTIPPSLLMRADQVIE